MNPFQLTWHENIRILNSCLNKHATNDITN